MKTYYNEHGARVTYDIDDDFTQIYGWGIRRKGTSYIDDDHIYGDYTDAEYAIDAICEDDDDETPEDWEIVWVDG